VKRVEQEMAGVKREGAAARAAMTAERSALEAEIARLMAEKAVQSAHADKAMLAKYEQLLKARKMVAVAEMRGEICTACHVRLRPAVTQQVRRNAEIVTCDSCQRILYYIAPTSAAPTAEASSSPA
jgi:predicted  nucleic acid-binding Zn-ribbon protein